MNEDYHNHDGSKGSGQSIFLWAEQSRRFTVQRHLAQLFVELDRADEVRVQTQQVRNLNIKFAQ